MAVAHEGRRRHTRHQRPGRKGLSERWPRDAHTPGPSCSPRTSPRRTAASSAHSSTHGHPLHVLTGSEVRRRSSAGQQRSFRASAMLTLLTADHRVGPLLSGTDEAQASVSAQTGRGAANGRGPHRVGRRKSVLSKAPTLPPDMATAGTGVISRVPDFCCSHRRQPQASAAPGARPRLEGPGRWAASGR